MKKIDFTTENVACVPGFQEAFVIAPLMDALIDNINQRRAEKEYYKVDRDQRSNYYSPKVNKYYIDDNVNVEKAYNILAQHGYCGTGDIDILPNGYPLVPRDK